MKNKTSTFYCIRCKEVVESTNEEDEGYFCPLCGRSLPNEPDADAIYEQMRDDEMFAKEDGK